MPVTIESIRLMRDGFHDEEMEWGEIIGLNVDEINIRIAASGKPFARMPKTIRVNLTSRVANQDTGVATLPASSPLAWDIPRYSPDPANASRTFYLGSRPIPGAGPFLARDTVDEVATVVRPGGTSDAYFRAALVNWTVRGKSTQPTSIGGPSGSSLSEAPNAFTHLQSAGVEVLSATIVPVPGQNIHSSEGKGLIRNPANIVYYSGHGDHKTGNLVIEIPSDYLPSYLPSSYPSWAGAGDLIKYWKDLKDLDVFIIAGCSVLKIDFSSNGAPIGTGVAWSNLLKQKGGPLQALLGYAGSAPLDTGAGTPGAIDVGNTIATEMGTRIAGGSREYVQDWLNINGAHRAWNAVGMDGKGYWTIDAPKTDYLWHTGKFSNQVHAIP